MTTSPEKTSQLINLWSLITRAASHRDEHPAKEDAETLLQLVAKGGGFGNELSLEVDQHGTWIIRVFNCFTEDDSSIELRITRNGSLTVTRKLTLSAGVEQQQTLTMR